MTAWNDPDLDALSETTRRFAQQHILPYQNEWESSGQVPRELSAEAGKLGLLGAGFPESAGGGGGGARAATAVSEALHEVGAGGGVVSALFTTGISLPHIIAAGHPDQITKWVKPALRGEMIGSLGITEPSGGSDVGRLRTSAVRDGDEWVINGEKTFITSGARADFVVTAVRTGVAGSQGISLIVVPTDTPGFTVAKTLNKLGWRSSDTAELVYQDVRVPVENLVGEENKGFQLISHAFVTERLTLASQAYATAQRCLDLAIQWTRDRETFGQPLITRQAVQNTLSQMAQTIDVARVYTRDLATRWDRATQDASDNTPGPFGSLDIVAHACFAKNQAVEGAEWVVYQAQQLFGGLGYMTEAEVEKHYRDIRILAIGGGTTEILTTLAAKKLGMVG